MRGYDTIDVLVDRLLQLPLRRGELLVRNDRRFQEPELIDGLLGEASVAVIDDPGHARKLAGLAHGAVEHLAPAVHGRREITRCRVLALSHLANAHRCTGDCDEADRLLDRALGLLEAGEDFPELARVYSILGSLRNDQHRLLEAQAAIRRSIEIAERSGDDVERARALCKLGQNRLSAMVPGQAERYLREALALLDPEDDPWGAFCVRNALIRCYVHTGRTRAARRAFQRLDRLQQTYHRGLTLRDWTEGVLAATSCNFGRAEMLLRRTWEDFRLSRSWDWGIALAALDVASLYAKSGRQAELKTFAREMTPTLFCRGLHPEAVTALGHLLRAIRFESVGPETIRAVYRYVHGSRFYPELKSPWV